MNHINSGLAHGTIGSPQTTIESQIAEFMAHQNEKNLSSSLGPINVRWKYVVKIKNEFLSDTIHVSDIYNREIKPLPLIHDDTILMELDRKARELYTSYYEFDTQENIYRINCERERASKELMISIIDAIKKRLNKINDGSLVVYDFVTERLKSL